jgi:hypothetical protein
MAANDIPEHEITANDLYYTNMLREIDLEDTYNKIFADINQKIKRAFGKHRDHIIYQVPKSKYKIENYNCYDCCAYLIQKLRKNGYYVRYYEPNNLYIELRDVEKEKEDIKKLKFLLYEDLKTKKILQENGSIRSQALLYNEINKNEVIDYTKSDTLLLTNGEPKEEKPDRINKNIAKKNNKRNKVTYF